MSRFSVANEDPKRIIIMDIYLRRFDQVRANTEHWRAKGGPQ